MFIYLHIFVYLSIYIPNDLNSRMEMKKKKKATQKQQSSIKKSLNLPLNNQKLFE